MWTIEYRPKTLKEFAGNKTAIEEIIAWIRNWKNEEKKILLLHGGPGTGKTTAMELIAKELNCHLIATNASDIRSANAISKEFGHSLQQQSLFQKGKLIIFDEADGLASGDRGGLGEILKISKTSKYPIILIANDVYHPKLRSLRSASRIIGFRAVHSATIVKNLAGILEKEKVEYDERCLKSIASTAGGDLKAAINDLEVLCRGKEKLDSEALKIHGYRDSTKSVFDALKIIFKTMSAQNAGEAIHNIDIDTTELIQWVRENLPLEYSKAEDVAEGYENLSRADVFAGRIVRQQYWGYLSYASQLASIGVATSKKERYSKFITYRYPTRIAMMGRMKARRQEREEFAAALGAHVHCSKKAALEYIPLIESAKKRLPREYEEFAARIGGLSGE